MNIKPRLSFVGLFSSLFIPCGKQIEENKPLELSRSYSSILYTCSKLMQKQQPGRRGCAIAFFRGNAIAAIFDFPVFDFWVFDFSVFDFSIFDFSVFDFSVSDFLVFDFWVFDFSVFDFWVFDFWVFDF
jgi:hypothetical protein